MLGHPQPQEVAGRYLNSYVLLLAYYESSLTANDHGTVDSDSERVCISDRRIYEIIYIRLVFSSVTRLIGKREREEM
jgi:hypothetical protein